MPKFKYTGKTIQGEKVEGVTTAETKKDLIVNLRKEKVYPVKITPLDKQRKEVKFTIREPKVTLRDLAIFCRQFSTIIESGISLIECLDLMQRQTENKRLQSSLSHIYSQVQKGVTLSKAMRDEREIYPDILINMVKAGELTGQLALIFDRLAIHFENENKIKRDLRSAMIYPIILITVATFVCGILLVFVLPNFVDMFAGFGVELPIYTKVLIKAGELFKAYWYVVLLSLVVLIYAVRRFIGTEDGRIKFDNLLLNMPIIGSVNRKVVTSRFSRTLAAMLQSGISIIEAVEIVSDVVQNQKVKHELAKSLKRIKKGELISASLSNVEAFPAMVCSMIEIGEETGSIESLLETVANLYDDEVDVAIKGMIELINPIILFVMAFIVGSIVMAVALPMFDMYNHLQF